MITAHEAGDGSQEVGEALSALFSSQPDHLRDFYGMMGYQLGLVDIQLVTRDQPASPVLSTQVCLQCARALGGPEAATRAAAALALLGNWFRIHDDIERQRARASAGPTVWSVWGVPQAINAGDGLFPLAVTAMLDVAPDTETALTLVRELAEASLTYTRGQYDLLSIGTQEHPPESEYLRAIELTSGSLTGYGACVGAVVAGASRPVQESLRAFGTALGTAAGIAGAIRRSEPLSLSPKAQPPATVLTPAHVRRYLEKALTALRHADLAEPAKLRLEAFARRRCAL